MTEERRTIKNWAARLSAVDEPLSIEEAQLLASISANDRLVELLTAQQDVQMRLARLELFVARTLPGYEAATTGAKALAEYRGAAHA